MVYIKAVGGPNKSVAAKVRAKIHKMLDAGYKPSINTCRMAAGSVPGAENATFKITLDGKKTRIKVKV